MKECPELCENYRNISSPRMKETSMGTMNASKLRKDLIRRRILASNVPVDWCMKVKIGMSVESGLVQHCVPKIQDTFSQPQKISKNPQKVR